MAELTITTVAERPEYADRLYELDDLWPEFMAHDKLANALFWQVRAALRAAVRKQGHDVLVAPVRPNAKHLKPDLPMTDYLEEIREDGLPADPWLRVHARAGARVVRVAPASMVMAGSLAEWRAWTGLPFDQSGEVVVPEALVPVRCEVEHDYAVYVGPTCGYTTT